MTPLDAVGEAVAVEGLRLRRAWPRDAGHLLLDLVPAGAGDGGAGGPAVAGQWFADDDRARSVAEWTTAARGLPPLARAGVRHLLGTGVVLQPSGADRRLPALAALVAEPGAALVAHRPERRAVVRTERGDYTKVVRPERTAAVAAAAVAAGALGVRVPAVVSVEPDRGLVTTAALPGRPLHDLLRDPHLTDEDRTRVAVAAGATLGRLHASVVPRAAAPHSAGDEAAVSCRWLALAAAYGLLPPRTAGAAEQAARRGREILEGPPEEPSPLHRDLHDKQVLVDADAVGLLDFDLAAAGEPALDVANLLVHLELRGHQGLLTPHAARVCADALLSAYAPTPLTRARIAGYDLLARARLVGVYAFRPRSGAAAQALLEDDRRG